MILFTVRGIPAPQGSKSYLGQSKGGKPRFQESSKRVPPWRADVRTAAEAAMRDADALLYRDDPVAVELAFRMPRPKGHFRPANSRRPKPELAPSAPIAPAGVPDLDKLARAILDALTGVVWKDDGQVVDLKLTKRYADFADPGVDVRVREL